MMMMMMMVMVVVVVVVVRSLPGLIYVYSNIDEDTMGAGEGGEGT